MTENQNRKLDELFLKIRALSERVKTTRDSFGQPFVDRAIGRLTRISAKLPEGNDGDSRSRPQQPPEIPRRTCPKCGQSFGGDIAFCSDCGFSFGEEKRRQQHEQDERQRLERNARASVIS